MRNSQAPQSATPLDSFVITTTPLPSGDAHVSAYGPFNRTDAYDFAVEFDARHAHLSGYSSTVTCPIESPSYLIGSDAAELWRGGEDWTERTPAALLRATDLRIERIRATAKAVAR